MKGKTVIKELICPSCGGKMIFDPAIQKNVCSLCGNAYIINPYHSLEELASDNQKAKCPNCGAPLRFDPSSQKAVCPACDSEFSIVQETNEEENTKMADFRPDSIVPFSTTKEEVQTLVIHWLTEGEYVPTDILDKIRFYAFDGAYLPYYEFVIAFDVDWTASIGYNRIEQYEEEKTVYDGDGYSHKEIVLKERTVTDWCPMTGHATSNMKKQGIAVNPDRNLAYPVALRDEIEHDEKVMREYLNSNNMCPPGMTGYDNEKAFYEACEYSTPIHKQPFDERYLAGFSVVPFELDANATYNRLPLKEAIVEYISKSAPGDAVKDVHWSGDVTVISCESVYSPVWSIQYCYNNANYWCAVTGDKNEIIDTTVSGTKPRSQESITNTKRFYLPLKIYASVLTLTFLISFIVSIVSSSSDFFEFMLEHFLLLLLLLVGTFLFGFIGRRIYLSREDTQRKAKLNSILANPEAFFARRPDPNEPENKIVNRNRRLTPEEIRARNKDPRFLLKNFRWLSIGFALLVFCIDIFVSISTGLIGALAFSFVYMIALLPCLIPYFIFSRKVQKNDKAYKASRDYLAIGAIIIAFILLSIIGAIASSVEEDTPYSSSTTISSQQSTAEQSDSVATSTISNTQESRDTSNELQSSQSTSPQSTYEPDSSVPTQTESPALITSSPPTQAPQWTVDNLVNEWNRATNQINQGAYIDDFSDISSGNVTGFSAHSFGVPADISFTTTQDKSSFTLILSNVENDSEISSLCYTALALASANYSDNSFYQDFDNGWTDVDGSTSKKVCSYYGYRCTIIIKQVGARLFECEMTGNKS